MKILEAVEIAKEALAAAGIENARAEAESLVSELLNTSRTQLALQAQMLLDASQEVKFHDWLKRRSQREALQHICGYAYFYDLKLTVNKDVLIPRPETEVLVEYALNCIKDSVSPLVIDVGTGSGAIALAIKEARPDARVVGTDIEARALTVAQQNAKQLNLDIHFYQSDLLTSIQELANQADMIVSNPPYLPNSDKTEVSPEVQSDPSLALYSGDDGLDIFRCFEQQCFELLKANTQVVLELDHRNSQSAFELCTAWQERKRFTDLLNRERFLYLLR